MSVENLYQKVIEKIRNKEIKPKSRWHFLLKNYLIWAGGALALIISAGAFSVMTYLFKYNDLSLRHQINKNYFELLFLTLPYFWMVFLVVFIFIIYYNIKHTKKGYRYPLWLIAIISFLGSLLLGIGFSWAGLGEKIDQTFLKGVPLYAEFINPQVDFWSHPEEGRLVGLCFSLVEDNQFQLIDKNSQGWVVTLSDEIKNQELLNINQPVRVLGKQISDSEFLAEIILPLMPGRGFFERFHQASGTPPMPHRLFLENHRPPHAGRGKRRFMPSNMAPSQEFINQQNIEILD